MRKFVIILFACINLSILNAQNVAIQAVMPNNTKLPTEANSALLSKMQRMTSQNGFGSSSSPFILTSSVNIIDKKVTATAPAQYVVNLEVVMYIVNLSENLLIGTVSFPLNSIDASENKAIVRAINRLNVNSVQARRFMEISRAKIVDYYALKLPEIITKAQALAKQKKYNEALICLSSIPNEIENYDKVVSTMQEIYNSYFDNEMDSEAIQNQVQLLAQEKLDDSKTNASIQSNLNTWLKSLVK